MHPDLTVFAAPQSRRGGVSTVGVVDVRHHPTNARTDVLEVLRDDDPQGLLFAVQCATRPSWRGRSGANIRQGRGSGGPLAFAIVRAAGAWMDPSAPSGSPRQTQCPTCT